MTFPEMHFSTAFIFGLQNNSRFLQVMVSAFFWHNPFYAPIGVNENEKRQQQFMLSFLVVSCYIT